MQYEQLELPIAQIAEQSPKGEAPEQNHSRLTSDINRSRLMDALYEADGRESKEHPKHGILTGLGEEFYARLGRAIARIAMTAEGFSPETLLHLLESDEIKLKLLDV